MGSTFFFLFFSFFFAQIKTYAGRTFFHREGNMQCTVRGSPGSPDVPS